MEMLIRLHRLFNYSYVYIMFTSTNEACINEPMH